MAKDVIDRLTSYGVGFAYALILSVFLAICAVAMLTAVLFVAWWNKIH